MSEAREVTVGGGWGPTDSRTPLGDLLWLRPRGEAPVPLRYWSEGPFAYVVAARSARRWVTSVLREGGCDVGPSAGAARPCSADLVIDPAEAESARLGLRTKYGTGLWEHHFRPTDRVLRLDLGRPPSPPSPNERLRAEFDAVAPGYTRAVESHPLERYLKTRTASWLLEQLDGTDPLLEIGPGTGFETLPLLRAGHRILAVDISARMLGELSARARSAGVGDRLETRVAPLCDLARAVEGYGDAAFGAAYSTFGAFNLEADLEAWPGALARAVRPGGTLIFTSLNHPGVSPVAWELLLGRVREAVARLHRTMPADGFRHALDVHLRNPGFWDRLLAPSFERRDLRPVSVLVPPFDSPKLLEVLGAGGRRRATGLDAALSRHRLLSPLAEWAILTYGRRPAVEPVAPAQFGTPRSRRG